MEIIRRDLVFFMSKLHDDIMQDVGVGAEVSNSELRDLHDFVLPQITKAIDDCRKVLKVYTSHASYDRDLARDAQERCEDASIWTTELLSRYHRQRLHLDKNMKHREITFTPFKPGGEISIYQFLNRFETWADGYLSEEAKADQLYNKYLDKSITESYTEISLLQGDFEEMKTWLIKKYGSVVPIAHGCIKAILKLKVPCESNHSASVQYLRSIHRLLVNLSELEISKGRPVPKLQNYLGSNAFLSALIEAIPLYIKNELFKELLNEDIDDIDTIEGRHHLETIVRIIKLNFMRLELIVKSSPAPVQNSSSSNQQPKKAAKPGTSTHVQAPNNPNPQQVAPIASNPPSQGFGQNQSYPPVLTGGNAAPIGNSNQYQPSNQQYHPNNQQRQNYQQSQPNFNRWSCPIKNHSGHNINECVEFWSLNPQDRRWECKFGGCYTCLDRTSKCRGGCKRIQEVPAELICADCANSTRNGFSPVCILMCGLRSHTKPTVDELRRAVEAWIPNLNLQSLGAKMQVNLTTLGFHKASVMTPPPPSKTNLPSLLPSKIVYDTTTGESRSITQHDTIIKTSSDTAFYTMQTLRIKDQDALVLYDSGSNGHLINGQLAEKLKLNVVTCEIVPVGGLGGKVTWSDYGKYSITLGPDINGECHELEMQGLNKITNELPKVDLQGIWDEANTVLHGKRQMPIEVGGTSVQILIGIKSTQMSPKLKFSLPNGLGIYESVFYDIYQSNICFGGPHPIFTQAYREAGYSVNHMEAMFTKMARAYMDTPRTFIRVDVDEHGPPLDLARELDLIEEIKTAFPAHQKSEKITQSIPSVSAIYSVKEEIVVTDANDCPPSETKNVIPTSEDNSQETWNTFNSALDHCEHINCMKSAIPLSKLKGLQDELDIPEIVEFRCDSCANCPTCKLSARAKTKSLQESFEQEVIEKSVHVDMDQAKVWVDLPFIKEPVEYLSKKHSGPNNYNQALRVYQAQCSKRDEVKDQVRKAHQELVDKGYMQKITDLPKETQTMIQEAPFHHYYPWRAVYKEDSVTTPVRLVVDPTMTGLNEILAKGTNMLSKIPELLIRFRCFKHTWNTDISKLYNQLHLNDTSLPYSLFLYNKVLDKKTPPIIWVMSRAWYGVSSTGNQAGVALEFLANHFQEEYPAAHSVITSSRYVDDVLSGGNSEEEVEQQIKQTEDCLKHGGFSLKYVARSGHKPPPKASSDGRTVGCLGLAWNTEEDTLSLAFSEDFFIKRLKGQKAAPDLNLKDPAVLDEALSKDLMTRAGILSRVAELYDPCGWWEPIKVQMKLSMQHLNGLEWTAPVPAEHRQEWVSLFNTMNKLKEIHIKRSIIPESTMPEQKLRVITVADAAAKSCGCAIYAGVEKDDGSYSCNLILAKSKMVHSTIPRNELEGVVLAAEASLMVQRALSGRLESIRYYTDSRIVVCWVLNQSKRLRMWAYNRVQAIHSMIKRVENNEEHIPLYHISGLENIADLLTKPKSVSHSDLQTESVWYTGLTWMALPNKDLPSDQFISIPENLEELYNQETFQEVAALQATTPDEARVVLLATPDPETESPPVPCESLTVNMTKATWFLVKFKFKELGWQRARNRLRLVLKACAIFKHGRHELANASWSQCYLCRNDTSYLLAETDRVIDWAASRQTQAIFTKQKLEERFHLSREIWYSRSRLVKEGAIESLDLDCSPFFDHQHIKKLLPIVFTSLDIFHSYLAFIHDKLFPHMGVENTLRRIKERFYPLGNARGVITAYRSKCPKCRLMIKKVVSLELAQFPLARTTVAPPFWAVQMDIAMSFKAKPTINSRKTFPCHALIIVCLLTSATNILVLDGLTTQAVVQAIERHSARYGVPAHLYVDSGTQLEKLQDASFQLRDINTSTSTHRFKVTVAVPKAHQQQGRVEAKIKTMRKMLTSWSTSCDECNTLIGWETLFARVASAIDDVPIARGSASAPNDLGWEIITPNRLKLGRNNYRQLDGPIKMDNCPQNQLERNRMLTSKWYEIFIERLSLLIPPPEKKHDQQPIVGDVVLFLFTDPNLKKLWVWKLGVIEEKLSRSSYKIRYSSPDGTRRYVQRAVGQISIIVSINDLCPENPELMLPETRKAGPHK